MYGSLTFNTSFEFIFFVLLSLIIWFWYYFGTKQDWGEEKFMVWPGSYKTLNDPNKMECDASGTSLGF